ncbi:hypothetical protein ONA70_18620 [Micromonospora yasonensis]|nr:hypothetical protein [Micromonospora yasonensis]MCW3842116.1 hypothetical protein [Micromonospora yasonensis]
MTITVTAQPDRKLLGYLHARGLLTENPEEAARRLGARRVG